MSVVTTKFESISEASHGRYGIIVWLIQNVGREWDSDDGSIVEGPAFFNDEYSAWRDERPTAAAKFERLISNHAYVRYLGVTEGDGWTMVETCSAWTGSGPWLFTIEIEDELLALQFKLVHA